MTTHRAMRDQAMRSFKSMGRPTSVVSPGESGRGISHRRAKNRLGSIVGRFLLAERGVDLLLDVPVVLAEPLLLLLGEDPERHTHQALRELHVQPVLAVLGAAGHVEIEL